MIKMNFRVFIIFILSHFVLTGCASIGKQWKSLISGGQAQQQGPQKKSLSGSTYSQQNNLSPSTYRKYKRAKRKDIEDDAHLESKSGSLWVMEGQGAYLFSENTVRLIGDPIAVRIEGDPAEQLSAKSTVINKLLTQLEERRRRAMGRGPAGEEKKDDKKPDAAQTPAAPGAPGAAATAGAPPVANEPPPPQADEKQEFNVKTVPTRIIERLVDGNYRVRGVQPFMIKQREYKVIVTGIIRSEDFNEQGVSATQLLDGNFDIVSSKSTEMR